MGKPSPNGHHAPPTIDLGPWWIWPVAAYTIFALWFNAVPMLIATVAILGIALTWEIGDQRAKRRAREARSR